jgi:hypothetical protein
MVGSATPAPQREEAAMHPYKLELPNGEPADPPTFQSSEPNWRVGDVIFLGPKRVGPN